MEAALWRVQRVIELSDIRGDLHSSYSDGLANIRNLAFAAAKRGYQYLAIRTSARRRKTEYQIN